MISFDLIAAVLSWCAAAVVLAWLAPARLQPLAMLICGAGLLATVSPTGLALTVGFGLAAYQAGRLRRGRGFAIALLIAVIAVGFLALLRLAAPVFAHDTASVPRSAAALILPFGIAYTSLRLIHYLIEVHKESLGEHGRRDLLCYLLLPPVLAVGPIHRFDAYLRDLRRRRWDSALFDAGAGRVMRGAVKVVVIGNWLLTIKLHPPVAALTAHPDWLAAWVRAAWYWGDLYVQFSGYCDIAIGLSAMMGFRVRENFDRPYLSANISEFWRRWHMSLTSWCRDYVYVPVLALSRRPLLALAASMLSLSLWHAVSMHYLIWGLYQAAGIAIHRAFHARAEGFVERLPGWGRGGWTLAARFLTLNFIILSFPVASAVERLAEGL